MISSSLSVTLKGWQFPRKKKFLQKTEWTEQLVCTGGIPAVPLNRKLSEFCSEPFLGREKCLEFYTIEQKWKLTLGIPLRTIPRKRKMLGIPFRGTEIEANSRNSILKHFTTFEERTNYFVELFWLFLKLIFLCM
jgi:hypothetical protein